MITFEQDIRTASLKAVAQQMMTAARTAPKARGVDNLTIMMIDGQDIERLAIEMERMCPIIGKPFFARDAANIRTAGAVILIGSRVAVMGLNCGYCGFPTCADKNHKPQVPCFFNAHDMGVAVGSAVSVAADCRVDSRVMFSVGYAAQTLGMMPEGHSILGIPISSLSKSPFFDR